MKKRFSRLVLVILAMCDPALGSTFRKFAQPPAAEREQRFAQLGYSPNCVREVDLKSVSITEDRELAIGIYEEIRDRDTVLGSQEIVLFGLAGARDINHSSVRSSGAFLTAKPGLSCNWTLIEPEGTPSSLCEDESKCRATWAWRRTATSVKELERVQVRFELRKPKESELKYVNIFTKDEEQWIGGVYFDWEIELDNKQFLLSPSGHDRQIADEVVTPFASRQGDGVEWSYKPLVGLGAESVAGLTPKESGFRVGYGPKSRFSLKNDFIKIVELGKKEKAVELKFEGEYEPWIVGDSKKIGQENVVAANIFLNANDAIIGLASIYPWFEEHFNDVHIVQTVGDSGETCKAKWLGFGLIKLPLRCNVFSDFYPKGLCSEIVTHELVHELSSRLLSLTSGGEQQDLWDEALWEAIADYLAVSLAKQGDGVYGAYCGEDLRSIKDGLYQPQLLRPKSFLEEPFGDSDDSNLKSLLISSALFDLAPALKGGATSGSERPLSHYRRIIDRLVTLSLMLGGHEWRSFLEILVELVEDLLPDDVDAVCQTLWDHHQLFTRGCAGHTRTTLFDLEDGLLKGTELEIYGFVARGDLCEEPYLVVEIKGHRPELVQIKNINKISEGLLFKSTVLKGSTPADIKASIKVQCKTLTPLKQGVKVRQPPIFDEIVLARAAREVDVNLSAADPQRLWFGVIDNSGVLTFEEATFDPVGKVLTKIGQPWVPAERHLRNLEAGMAGTFRALDHKKNALPFEPSKRRNPEEFTPLVSKFVFSPSTDPNLTITTFVDPPGVNVRSRGDDSEASHDELITFPDSKCSLPPNPLRGPKGEVAAFTCDGFLKILHRGQAKSILVDVLQGLRPLFPEALAMVDVDGDGEPELVVGPLAEGWAPDAFSELHAFEWDGTPVGGQWPIRSDLQPTAPPVFEDLDGDGCPEVVLASDRIQVWDPNPGLGDCR